MKKEKGASFIKEFKDFISKGNVVDLAVGVIIGGAFSGIVTSLVENIITPVITLVTGKVSFTDLFIALDGNKYATLAAANEAGASTINYGLFIQGVIDFIITAFVIFLLVKGINTLRSLGKKPEEEAPLATTKTCPYCKSEINIEATRCPHCTSEGV
ncbi:MAG: large conductance mechanosensitive channel protein MscL [Oscillospiraceae bacterium]|nr:large conductance mechanosensitive channel protein MscL [Oscillospiraceae bacterium]